MQFILRDAICLILFHLNIESLKNIIASEAAFWASQIYILIQFFSQVNVLCNQIELVSFSQKRLSCRSCNFLLIVSLENHQFIECTHICFQIITPVISKWDINLQNCVHLTMCYVQNSVQRAPSHWQTSKNQATCAAVILTSLWAPGMIELGCMSYHRAFFYFVPFGGQNRGLSQEETVILNLCLQQVPFALFIQ